ncbi:hypothetical protein ACFOPX_03520 [Helicobacter baculiformis]|uniref:Septum formation initiator n=1 Tax=Helicobacter baculiformis TaxID=427351 RepID=A0ABV7ZGC4_9HELI|nr:hypothetical protein [Helicobacter baculiformis]
MPHTLALDEERLEERRLRTSAQERDALFSEETIERQGISLAWLLFVIVGLVFTLILFAPKIYLTDNIYYTSRAIQKLKGQESLLQEEKRQLQLELEKQRYKYTVENMP